MFPSVVFLESLRVIFYFFRGGAGKDNFRLFRAILGYSGPPGLFFHFFRGPKRIQVLRSSVKWQRTDISGLKQARGGHQKPY